MNFVLNLELISQEVNFPEYPGDDQVGTFLVPTLLYPYTQIRKSTRVRHIIANGACIYLNFSSIRRGLLKFFSNAKFNFCCFHSRDCFYFPSATLNGDFLGRFGRRPHFPHDHADTLIVEKILHKIRASLFTLISYRITNGFREYIRFLKKINMSSFASLSIGEFTCFFKYT